MGSCGASCDSGPTELVRQGMLADHVTSGRT